LGKDFSGNGNFFATNNISITAGSTYDSMTDVPTLTSATAANFAVINPLDFSGINGTITNGNLTWTTNTTGSTNFNRATMRFPTSGKFYAECTVTQLNIGSGIGYGVVQLEGTGSYLWWVYSSPFYQIYGTGGSYSTIPTISSGDVIMVAIDMDAGKAWYGQNGTWLLSGDPANGTAMSNPATFTVGSSNIVLSFDGRTGSAANIINANFGQRPFAYTPPTGFLRLNTFNLPTPTIGATASTLAEKYMDISLYSGTSAGGNNITDGLSLSSGGLLWVKNRNASGNHALIDSVRGITKRLISDTSNAEDTVSAVTSFNANGFTLQGSDGSFNLSGRTYVGWQWLANGSGVSNTDGSITSTVSANTSAGFSVVTYTGNGTSGATVGHGLGVVPAMLIIKNRTTTPDWMVYHKNASATPQNGGMFLNRTDAFVTDSNYFNNTAPISTRFTVGGNDRVNTNGNNYVAYCFSQVAGYSAFGSYTGNGSTDGPFVFTGFRPKWIMWKNASTTSGWGMRDTSRNPSNVANLELAANADAAEVAGQGIDILSNGFKLRTADSWYNGNGNTMIYMAFAENPFKYSLAR
jgi:hypothetical protein